MKITNRLLLIAALFVLVLPLVFTGTTSAKYQSDGATQNGTTGGWNAPTDGICVLALHADGTMDVDTSITTARDCQAKLISVTATTSNDTLANACGNSTKNTAGVKYAAPAGSTCVTVDASKYINGSISMVNLDRNAQMCNAKGGLLANAGAAIVKNTANGTSATCIAYGWQYRGQDASGAPLGTVNTGATPNTYNASAPGFCYSSMLTGLTNATCPTVLGSTNGTATSDSTTAFGYSAASACVDSSKTTVGTCTGNQSTGHAYSWDPAVSLCTVGSYTSSTCTGGTLSWNNFTKCTYAYGINGPLNAALTDVTTATAVINGVTAAATATVDLSTLTTQGACLANGGSWSQWIPASSTTTIGTVTTAETFDLTRQAVNADDGCLHCHSYKSQQNGPAERFKDSYLMTGHKNMLRKVTQGMNWAGPNSAGNLAVYTTDGTNAMTWSTGSCSDSFGSSTACDGTNPMYYIYGDWMAPNPTVAIKGSNYSCANCHSTGFGNGTTAQTPAIPGVQSIGTPGYGGTQPADAGAGYVSAVKTGWQWDIEGITCARCHNATVPSVTAAQIVASSYPSTAPTSGGMGALASGTGRFNLCFGCHGGGSMGKLYNGSTQYAGGTAAGATQYDPTIVGAGAGHGATYGRDGNGHILGNEFLNSPHARYAGKNSNTTNGGVIANALGENDLFDPNGTTEYSSIFKGYTCWQSNNSNSPAKTYVGAETTSGQCTTDGGQWSTSNSACVFEITTKATCESIYGAGSWRADQDGSLAATSIQGTCTTCHDVHNSLFANSGGEAIRKTCEVCHVTNGTSLVTDATAPQVVVASMAHPGATGNNTAGTPWDTNLYESPCVVCHMATQALANGDQNSMAQHIWRINTSSTYSTFPTPGQFYGGTCSGATSGGANTIANAPYLPAIYKSDTSSANCTTYGGTWTTQPVDKNMQVAPEGTYTNAVWVDLDLACGQCHGGSLKPSGYSISTKDGSGNTITVTPPTFNKTQLSAAANALHSGGDATGCLSCHSSIQGTYRAVIQGTNHHNGSCTTCHTIQHRGTPIDMGVNLNANILKPAGSHNPLPYWSINTSVVTFCLSCHSSDKVRSGDGATLKAIVPSDPGDNHHNGHSGVPGTNYGGVSAANGSRGDNDPGMNCLGCHGKSNVVSGNNTIGYTMTIAASGLSTTTVSTQNSISLGGANATSNLCLGCHGDSVVQSGPTQNHHAGICATCHHIDGSYSGTYPAGVGSPVMPDGKVAPATPYTAAMCQNCHASATTKVSDGSNSTLRAVNQGVDHHNGNCITCHGTDGGVTAMPAPTYTLISKSGKVAIDTTIQTSCLTCHSSAKTRSSDGTNLPAIVQSGAGDNHHQGHAYIPGQSGTDPGLYCLGCHGSASVVSPTVGSTYSITSSGLTPAVVSVQKGLLPNANNTPGINAVSILCVQCHSNVDSGHGSITQEGTGKNHHSGDCLNCHVPDLPGGPGITSDATGVAQTPSTIPSWVDCSQCHGATPMTGTISIVQSGATRNHHAGACSECHTAAGVPAMPAITDSDASVLSGCLSCHSAAKTRSSDGSTLAAITPSVPTYGPVDNHHQGHGGNTADPVGYRCLGCHGKTTLDGSLKILASGLPADVTSTLKGLTGGVDATSSLCEQCHAQIQSGPTQNHHAGACLTCHVPDQDGGPGITKKTVGGVAVAWKPANLPTWVDCTACHGATPKTGTVYVNQGVNHHSGVCTECHTAPGVPANNSSAKDNAACLACHGSATSKTIAINPTLGDPNKNHHGGVAAFEPQFGNCTVCHGADGGIGANHAGKSLAVDGNNLCLTCHDNSATSGYGKHHATTTNTGNCVTCHAINGTGVVPPAGVPVPVADYANASCQSCHSSVAFNTLKWNMNTPTHTIACTDCHGKKDATTGAGTASEFIQKPVSGTVSTQTCLSCHGASGPGKTLTQAQIDGDLVNIHTAAPTGADFSYSFGSIATPADTQYVNVTGTATCASGTCSYGWNFNGEGNGTGSPASYRFAAAGSKTITLTVTDAATLGTTSVSKTITVQAYTAPPTANGSLTCNWTSSVTDTSTGTGSLTDTVNWGDGGASTSITSGGSAVNHTYVNAGTYTVILKSVDSKGQTSTKTFAPCIIAKYSISGTTEKASGAVLGGVSLVLRNFNTTQSCTTSPAIALGTSNATTGAYSFTGLNPGTYGVCASKSGSTFTAPAGVGVATVGPNVPAQIIKSVL